MRRLAAIVATTLPLLAAAPAGAELPPVPKSCAAGVTGFVGGPLRIFGIPRERTGPFGPDWGADHHACLEGTPPFRVGADLTMGGTVSWPEGALARSAVLPGLGGAATSTARVRCGAGATAFVDGNLRIFGVHYRTSFERGFEEYACLGRRRPLLVGGVGSDNGVGSAVTTAYAHAGRYLAASSQSDSEGGPSADVRVVDLVRRRTVSFANLACCEWTPAIRLARDGTLAVLSPGEGLFVKPPGRRARTLAPEGTARDLAMHGGTLYWTEGGAARSATLPAVGGGEATALEPVRLHRRGGRCAAARGRTIAASGSVRVYETGNGRFACRIGRRPFALAGSTTPRIAGDRWLLVFGEGSARVIDTRTGRAGEPAGEVREAVLQADGGLAWLDREGRVLGRFPGSGPGLIAGPGASQLAAARRAVYWMRDGVPHVWRVARPLPD